MISSNWQKIHISIQTGSKEMKAVITILECNSDSVVSHVEQKLLPNNFILKKCDGRKTTAHTFVTGAIC